MKRIIICSILLLGAVAASFYSYAMVEKLNEEINLRIGALTDILYEERAEEVIEQSNELVDFWKEEEKRLVHFVRHSHIDVISVSMARLPALAQYGDYTEIYAELLSIRRQMEHIRESEQVSFNNLL